MFGKVKKWLGIEGVKIEIKLDSSKYKLDDEKIKGTLHFLSVNQQYVEEVEMKLVERYSRGKNSEKLIDEYILGQISLKSQFIVAPNEPKAIHFSLPFKVKSSEIDALQKKNILLNPIIKLAKWYEGVESDYRIEVRANVKDVALPAFAKEHIHFE